MDENKNFRYDEKKNIFYFKRCPRTFLKTDVPARHPRTDCPFRSRMPQIEDKHYCYLPSGLYYAERMVKGIGEIQLFQMWRECSLKSQTEVERDKNGP